MVIIDDMYLYGASGHGKVIKEIVEAQGGQVNAFVDDNPAINELAGLPVLHKVVESESIIISIGVNAVRKKIAERLNCHFGVAIHPAAVVSPTAKIGEGTVVMAGAIINAGAVIGKHCIINTGATVDHDVVLGDFVHVAPGANISGATEVGECTWIGVGSCVIQCLTIGKNCMIGAGSVVVNNLPDDIVAYGNPCRVKDIIDNRMGGGKPLSHRVLRTCVYNRIYA